MIQSLSDFARRAWRDERGVAAIEFAFIAPILFVLYFMTMEVSQAIETNKKVGRVASMVGDLVAQQREIRDKAELDNILDIGAAIIQPYARSEPTIIIEHIEIEDRANPKALVIWSRKLENGSKREAVVKQTETTVPEQLLAQGTFLVRVTTQLGYQPVITWTADQKTSLGLTSAFDLINMSERYYLRPRMAAGAITCTGC